jgi:hypothetical protein
MQAVNPRLMWADKRWILTPQNDGVVYEEDVSSLFNSSDMTSPWASMRGDISRVCDTGCGSKADPQRESLRLALSRKCVGFGLLRDGGL